MSEMAEYISITSFGRDGLNIAAYNMPGQDMKTSYISETNLTVAFQDYLIWLEDSDFVFSEEETLVALKKARNTLLALPILKIHYTLAARRKAILAG